MFLGGGCTDTFQTSVANATTTIQTKTAEISAALEQARQQYEKMKAIYDIINAPTEPESTEESTPSVPPSEDQPLPATAENTSSP